MAKSARDDAFEAVMFLDQQYVSRQMRYAEFEALLDGVIPAGDIVDRDVTAVFLETNTALEPVALVFFKIYFDENGLADPDWNVPLKRLAKISGQGPDLGAGPIRLACRSQCAISWHQKDLWDPDMSPAGNDFQIIRRAIAENKLGFEAELPMEPLGGLEDDEDDIPLLTTAVRTSAPEDLDDLGEADFLEEQEKQHRTKLARVLKAQRLRIKTLNSQHEAEVEELVRQHRIELQGYKSKLRDQEQTVQHNKVMYDQMKGKLQKRNDQFLGLQDDLGRYKKKLSLLQRELQKALPNDEVDRLKKRMEDELTIVKDELDRRTAELYYRDEREEQLKAEIASLKERMASSESQDVLNRLAELDVVFVVYHPGAGHISLSLKDVRRYMEAPSRFIAEKCGVSEEAYGNWLKHYEDPKCKICSKPVTRVSVPSHYSENRSNRCADHQID